MAELDAAPSYANSSFCPWPACPGWPRERKGTPMPWSTIGRGDSCEGNLAVRWMREGGDCEWRIGGEDKEVDGSESMSALVQLDVVPWTVECGREPADRQRREGDGDSGGEKKRERERWSVLHVGPCWAQVTAKPPKLG